MTPALVNADWNWWPEGWAIEGLWASSAALGFDGIELGVYDPDEQLSAERLATYGSLVARHGLPVATVLYSMPPDRWPDGGLADPRTAPTAIEQIVTTARTGRDAFGCSVVGLWPGADLRDRRSDPAAAWPMMVAAIREVAERVAELGVVIALEYKPLELLANADAALRLVDAVDHPDLGILLDTGHALWAGEDLPVVVRLLGRHLRHIHLGDTPGPLEADLPPGWHHDFSTFIAALDEVGYQGVMTLDMYGAVQAGVVGAEAASRFGHETMVAAAARARGGSG